MDYKKIIAATAVTSAAFVVPAVVDAATPVTNMGFNAPHGFELGQVVTATDEYTPTTTGASAEKITKYEWFAVKGTTETPISKTKAVTVPFSTNDIDKLKLKITTASGEYVQEVSVLTNYYAEGTIQFEPFKVDGKLIEFLGTGASSKGIVNQPIQVKLPDDKKIIKYDWYIVDGSSSRLLGDEQDQIIEIPVAAADKILRVVATDNTGKMHIRQLDVNELELDSFEMDLKLNDKVINDANSSTTVTSIAPGDMLSVENLVLKAHQGKVELLQSQAIVSYQWFYKKGQVSPGSPNDSETSPETAPDTYSIIPGATGPMYLVPDNAFGRNLENISVAIIVEVPDSGAAIKTQYTYVIKLDNTAALELEDEISGNIGITNPTNTTIKGKLKDKLSKYDYTSDFDEFTKDMEAIKGKYDNLSTGSKALVPSYPKVTQALQDIKSVQALMKDLEAFTEAKSAFEKDPSELSHAKLVKQFEAIEKKYQKFDSLKRSLLEMDTPYKDNYIEVMGQYLKNITGYVNEDYDPNNTTDISKQTILKINDGIESLFDENDEGVRVYTFENLDPEPKTRAGMLTKITSLEDEIKKIDRKQQPVINASLLKTAKTDIKQVNALAEKIAAIDKLTGEKKIKAILSVREGYKKLTFMQQSLITEDELAMFDEDAYSEETVIEDLSAAINQLVNGTSYVFGSYTTPLLNVDATFANAIDVLLANYKALNSKAKKTVSNYAVLTQAKKDLTTATKVIKSITNAYDFHSAMPAEDVEKKMKSIQSKYRSAYNAYVKLTPLQRSIVQEISEISLDDLADELEGVTDEAFNPNDPDVEYDTTAIENVVSELTAIEAAVTAGTQSAADIETKIKGIEAAYKALKGAEKKGVYNYSILSRAKSLVKKAVSVESSLVSALNSGSTSRMNSAVKSYDKLTVGQKEMIKTAYDEVMTELENPDKEDLIDALIDLELEMLNEDQLKAIEELLAKVDKKEHKTIPGYSKYQEALKIQKAVDSFVEKFKKLDTEPTYSKKQSILKDFKKLTTVQLAYLVNSYPNETVDINIFETLKLWEEALNLTANTLNDDIGKLIVVNGTSYDYSVTPDKQILTNLETAIAEIKTKYKVLDAKERKLVTHYSFLSNIERDIKAVRKAIDVSATANDQTYQQTYNRLTNQQQHLFDLVAEPRPTAP